MSLNHNELFKQMAKLPQVREATRKKAEELRDYLELRWPEVNEVSEGHRAFLESEPERIIKVTESTRSNRPTHIVTVRHPGAVAKQAKDGFVTKAVKDVK